MSNRVYPCFVLKDGYVDSFSAAYFVTIDFEVRFNQIKVAKSLNGARHECRELSKLTGLPFYDESESEM